MAVAVSKCQRATRADEDCTLGAEISRLKAKMGIYLKELYL